VVSIRSYLEQGEQEAALRYVCSISEKAIHAILPVHTNVQTVVTQNYGYFSLSCQDGIFHFLVSFDENRMNSSPISTF
jgi:hypothetical protein